jgi:indolepyruvate ferredoxin oxidoreductase beta subunit
MSHPMQAPEPIRILIAALGGEGGGVLASWLQAAAIADGHFIQGTSVPGVAQRTGATTYYMEIVPGGGARHGTTRAPVLALNAAPGEVDLLVASELLEAVRAVGAGFVTPDRTTLVASTARVYTVDEKAAMGDGRVDPAKLEEVARQFARAARIAAFGAEAARLGCPISPLLLGAIAGSGVLPMGPEVYRAAIRHEGKAVESNLRGFEAGLRLATAGDTVARVTPEPARPEPTPHAPLAIDLPAPLASLPQDVLAVITHGVRRLADYQDDAYARDYVARLARLAGHPRADAPFMQEIARQLALRMSVEDVIRVAQLKLREARLARVRAESKAAPGEIVDVTEYLKPGPEEICGVLPARLGAWLLQRLPHDKAWAMTVRTTRISGFLRLKLLVALKRWRPGSLRATEEARWRADWLAQVERTLGHDTRAAQEVAALAGLVRGYGSTYARGRQNYAAIVAGLLAGNIPAPLLADALLQARLAASKDPEGQTLARVIAAVRETVHQQRAAAE